MRWIHPRVRLSRLALVAVAAAGVAWGVDAWQGQAGDAARHRAVQTMATAIERIRDERVRRGLGFSPDDIQRTGLIGEEMSPLVTTLGFLPAKRLSADPAFAAMGVDLLRAAGVRAGDVVAIGFSGSLPALNVAVLAAVSALGGEPIIISSVGTSQWGATDPEFTWLDMERVLWEGGIFLFRAAAAAAGGGRTSFLLEEGADSAAAAIRRSGLPEVSAASHTEAVAKRLAVYQERARGRPIRAFVNVGGASANLGQCDQSRIPPGLVRRLPPCAAEGQGLIHRFFDRGVPVIHLLQVQRLARHFGIVVAR